MTKTTRAARKTATKKTGRELDREIADAIAGLDRKIASAKIEGGELYWRGRRGSPVVKPHRRTSASCKTCGRFHTTKEHERHARADVIEATKTKKKTTSTKTKMKTAKRRSAPEPRRDPLGIVTDAVLAAPASDRFGDRKVFISRIWDRTKGETRMTLGEFKRWLIDAHMAKKLELARADLVSAMDPELVAASETTFEGERFPQWHFIVDPSK